MCLGLLEVLLLDHLLVKHPLVLVLARGVLTLVLALVDIMRAGGVLALLGAFGTEVVRATTAEAALLLTSMPVVHAVVVEPREPVDDQRQLIIPKCLHLLLYNRNQRR